ncbi:MAG TPA: hypothetical protein PKX05_05230, partial [bacterium]|nr:hypothetical protein [bacterium]
KMNILQKQFESDLNKYKATMGIYGALGGLGGALLSMKKQETKKTSNEITETKSVLKPPTIEDIVKDIENKYPKLYPEYEPFKIGGK